MSKKNRLILLCTLAVIILVSSITIGALAYYKITDNGWGQQIVTTSVTFKVNGQTIIDDATNYDLGLFERGDSAEVVLEVSTSANINNSIFVEYSLDFTTTDTPGHDLAKAIEVYQYIDGEYKFFNTLSNISKINKVVNINSVDYLYYKFVYSPTASIYFENSDFSLNIEANSKVFLGDTSRVMITDSQTFVKALADEKNSNKTLTLVKDISLDTTLVDAGIVEVKNPINIDLAGHNITLNDDFALNFNINNALVKMQNSTPKVGKIIALGEGKVSYNLNNGLVMIDDVLRSSYENIQVNHINGTKEDNFYRLANEVNTQIINKAEEVFYKNDIIDITKGLKYYFDYLSDQYVLNMVDNPHINKNDDSTLSIKNTYSEILTKTIEYPLTLTNGEFSKILDLSFTIRGTSPQAIAMFYLEQIPDIISSSVYFPSHDNSTNSTLTWITEDKNILSDYGIYLPNGIMELDSFSNTDLEITVIVSGQGKQSRMSKTVLVTLMTPEEKTNLIYGYKQILLTQLSDVVDFYNNEIDLSLVKKTDLQEIRVQPKNGEEEAFAEFLMCNNQTNFDTLSVKKLPAQEDIETIGISIKFIYAYKKGEDTFKTSFSVERTVNLIGASDAGGVLDPTYILQKDFESNAYVDGKGYQFLVMATNKGTYADYFVREAYQDFIHIENNVFVKNKENEGSQILYNDEYYWRYSYEGFTYILSNKGNYIFDGTNYVDVTSLIVNNTYDRYAKITILPDKVPSVKNTTAIIVGKLWEEKDSVGENIYLTDAEGNLIELLIKLNIEGIYQNTPEDIAHFGIYNKLLEIYDVNCDGWLSVNEAEYRWSDLPEENQSKLSVKFADSSYKYIDFSDYSIDDIKGLEYFLYLEGVDLSNNSIININQLDSLLYLKYLVLDDNKIAYLDSLAFLDRLEYLSISNLPLARIDAIRYLPNIMYLNLYKSSLTSYEPLTEYKKLNYLDIREDSSKLLSTSNETQYILALIFRENRNNNIVIFNDINSDIAWTSRESEELNAVVAGCTVLSEMVVVDKAYTTLNLPSTYTYRYYNGLSWEIKEYNILWEVNKIANQTDNYLTFIKDSSGKTIGYEITSPMVDTEISITVGVADVTSGTSKVVKITKNIIITLLQSQDELDVALIETSSGVFQVASTIIKDSALLEILFNIFNTNGDNKISLEERTTLITTDYGARFKDRNITTLEGIEYFTGIAFDNGIDLRGNTFMETLTPNENTGEFSKIDLSPLSYLVNLQEIRLSGQLYDLSQISCYSAGGNNSGITTLKEVFVSGCFDLDKIEVLTSLYKLYLANPKVDIYIDGDPGDFDLVVWNPYEELLQNLLSKLPKVYHFMQMLDSCNLFGKEDTISLTVNAYDVKEVEFFIAKCHLTPVMETYFSLDNDSRPTALIYKKYAGSNIIDNIIISFVGSDGKENISIDHVAGIDIEFDKKIVVSDWNAKENDDMTYAYNINSTTGYGFITIDNIFSSYALRRNFLNALYDNILSKWDSRDSMENIEYGYYLDTETNTYYITKDTLYKVWQNNPQQFTTDSLFDSKDNRLEIQGLKYINVTKLTLKTSANIGDGSELVNLTTLNTSYTYLSFMSLNVDLPNLTTINCNNLYRVDMYNKNKDNTIYYNMQHFTGLTTLVFDDCNIYDWEGLKALAEVNGSNNTISTITISASAKSNGSYNTNSNHNVTIDDTVLIINDIYEKSTATTKTYKIGSPSTPTDENYIFDPLTWWQDSSTELTYVAMTEYKEFSPFITKLGVKADGIDYIENTLQTLDNGTVLTLPRHTSKIFAGVTDDDFSEVGAIAERKFAIEWYAVNIDFAMANAIFNTNYNVTQLANNSQFVTISSPQTYVDEDITLNLTAQEHDVYFILTGKIGGGYYDNNNIYIPFSEEQESKYFTLPILLSGTNMGASTMISSNTRTSKNPNYIVDELYSDYFYNVDVGNGNIATYLSYSSFSCLNTRLSMAIVMSKLEENKGEYSLGGMMLYNVYNSSTNVSICHGVLGIKEISYTSNSTSLEISGYQYNGIAETSISTKITENPYFTREKLLFRSLKGFEYFLSLRKVELKDMFIKDIEPLQNLASWETKKVYYTSGNDKIELTDDFFFLRFNDNSITDVTPLSGFSKIKEVNFENNNIDTLIDASGNFVLKNSIEKITKIYFAGNYHIDNDDFVSIYNAMVENSGTEQLNVLDFNNTKDCYSLVALESFANIADCTGDKIITLRFNGAEDEAFSKSVYENFVACVNADTIYTSYVNNGYSANHVFIFNSNNITFKLINDKFLSFDNANLPTIPNNSIPVGTFMDMKVGTTISDILCFYTLIELFDKNGGTSTPKIIIDGVSCDGSEFDEGLFLAIVSNSVANAFTSLKVLEIYGDSTKKSSYNKNSGVFSIYSEGIKSLKGLEYFKNLTTLKIINANRLENLFPMDIELTKITTLKVENSHSVDENMLMQICKLPNLISIDLIEQKNLDFMKSTNTTIDVGSSSTNNLAGVIVYRLRNLKTFYYDNIYQESVFDKADVSNSLLQHYDKNNYLFNLSTSLGGVTPRTLGSFDDITSMDIEKANKDIARHTFISSLINKNAMFNTDFCSQSDFDITNNTKRDYLSKILLLSKSNKDRQLLPADLLAFVILDGGVVIYLPTKTYYQGEVLNIYWTLTGVVGDYLNTETGELRIDNSNFAPADLGQKLNLRANIKTASGYQVTGAFNKSINIIDLKKEEDKTITAPYYVEVERDVFVRAEEIFISSQLIRKIFIEQNLLKGESGAFLQNTINDYVANINELKIGSYLSYDAIMQTKGIEISNAGSINGLEIFTNVEKLNVVNWTVGNNSSINCARTMSLTDFTYSFNAEYSEVFDFSPLINSADTLKNITLELIVSKVDSTYPYKIVKMIEDISFIMMFSKLENITIKFEKFYGDFDVYKDKIIDYSLQYVYDYFNKNRPEVNFTITFDEETYTPKKSHKFDLENTILSSFEANNQHDITIFRNSLLKIKNSVTFFSNDITLKVPAYLESYGVYYEVFYKAYDSSLVMGNIVYKGASFSAKINETTYNITDGDIIEKTIFDSLLKTRQCQEILFGGKGDFMKEISINNYDLAKKLVKVLEIGVDVGGYYYYRNITLYDQRAWAE